MSKPCFVTANIFNAFRFECLTARTTILKEKLFLDRMYKEDIGIMDSQSVGFIVAIYILDKNIEYMWYDTFEEAYEFYHNYDIDLDKQ